VYNVQNRTVPTGVSSWVLARTDGTLPSPFLPPHKSLRKEQIKLRVSSMSNNTAGANLWQQPSERWWIELH